MTPHVLVVDDDPEIRSLLGRYLVGQGFKVALAGSGSELRRELLLNRIDLIVLDILLPDGTGLSLCQELRAKDSKIPIILLTALKEEVDRIIGLEIGADDYLGKPFNPRELVARIRTVLRRSGAPSSCDSPQLYRFLDFVLDPVARCVVRADAPPITLTAAEFDLLLAFVERPGRVLSREQVLGLTQNREKDADDFGRSVDVLVSRLRRKLGDEQGRHMFKTVRNGGYLFAVRVEVGETAP